MGEGQKEMGTDNYTRIYIRKSQNILKQVNLCRKRPAQEKELKDTIYILFSDKHVAFKSLYLIKPNKTKRI